MQEQRKAMTFDEASALVCGPGTMYEITEGVVLGQPSRLFVHTPSDMRGLYAMAAGRTDEFVIFEDERWTMPQLLNIAAQIAHALTDRLGVGHGDRVGIAMRNYPEWIASFVAITSIGAVAVPLNAWWVTDEFVYAIDDSGASVVICDDERAARIQAAPHGAITATLVTVRSAAADAGGDGADGGAIRLEDLIADGPQPGPDGRVAMPSATIAPDDDVTILYTSGTTGFPKGAVSTHRALLSSLMAFGARGALVAAQAAAKAGLTPVAPPAPSDPPAAPSTAPDPPSQPVLMLAVPLFHVTGLVPVMLGSFANGAKLVMTYRWDPERALELIESERVTHFVGVPTMSWDLLEAPSFASRDTSSLLTIGGGGAPMPPELMRRIDDEFTGGRPNLGYGMTETNAYGPQIYGDDFLARPTSTGRTVPVMQVRVTDPDGNELGPNETGEIWFRGPNLIRGYWNRPEATAETIVDGWLRSGDIGHIDEGGWVYVSDRAKDMVLRGGENVYSAHVEAAIYEHPAVYEAAVYGIPDERLGEAVASHVMVKPGETLTEDELREFLAERLAKFEVPSVITIVDEQLPRNASGKILKRALRDAVVEALPGSTR